MADEGGFFKENGVDARLVYMEEKNCATKVLSIDCTSKIGRRLAHGKIRHLAIVSEHRERLVKFYTEAFGMKVIDGVGPAIYLTDGYLNLAIIQKRPHYKEGLYHFGIEVDDIEKLKSVCRIRRRFRYTETTAESGSRVSRRRPGWQFNRLIPAWLAGMKKL